MQGVLAINFFILKRKMGQGMFIKINFYVFKVWANTLAWYGLNPNIIHAVFRKSQTKDNLWLL